MKEEWIDASQYTSSFPLLAQAKQAILARTIGEMTHRIANKCIEHDDRHGHQINSTHKLLSPNYVIQLYYRCLAWHCSLLISDNQLHPQHQGQQSIIKITTPPTNQATNTHPSTIPPAQQRWAEVPQHKREQISQTTNDNSEITKTPPSKYRAMNIRQMPNKTHGSTTLRGNTAVNIS